MARPTRTRRLPPSQARAAASQIHACNRRNGPAFAPAGTRQNQLWWDVYYSYSNDFGKTWATDIRVSDRSMNKNEGYTFHSNYGLGGPAGVLLEAFL